MKTKLALTAVTAFIVASFAISPIPAESYRGHPVKPGHGFVDENKDGVCDHTLPWVNGGKWHKHGNAFAKWYCPQGGWNGRGWGMKGGKMYPNLPDSGNSPSGGVTK
jgi:hypothetical protein